MPTLYLVITGTGALESTHLVADFPGQRKVQEHADSIGGLVAVLPILNDYRRTDDG